MITNYICYNMLYSYSDYLDPNNNWYYMQFELLLLFNHNKTNPR